MPDENKLDLKPPTRLEQWKLDEIQEPLWLQISRENFISLIKHVVDNLNNGKYKTIVDCKTWFKKRKNIFAGNNYQSN